MKIHKIYTRNQSSERPQLTALIGFGAMEVDRCIGIVPIRECGVGGLLGKDMVMKMQPGGVVRYMRISRYVVFESEFLYAHISDW
jgi:hypothetical protein